MFKTFSGLINNAVGRVSADTKTCGSPQSCHLLAVCVSLLANRLVLYHIYHKKSNEIREIVH